MRPARGPPCAERRGNCKLSLDHAAKAGDFDTRMKPLIGISCCVKPFGVFGTPNHAASESYVRVALGPVGGIPVLLPAAGEALVPEILPRLDGLILTGSRSNVCPDHYEGPPHAEGTPEDHARDATTLPLIRAAIAAGLPLLAICRGFQELNSTPADQRFARVRVAKAHSVRLVPESPIAQLAGGVVDLPVNSLHNQGIARLAPRLIAEGWAPDGTVEAVRVRDARGFALGVQWHPEYDWESDPVSRSLFEAFGKACQAWADRRTHRAAAE